MKKILPIAEPIADAYAHMGMEFSMFLTCEKYYPWIINDFIQIYTLKDMQTVPERSGTLDFFFNRYGDWQMFHFSSNPYLDYEKISYSTLKTVLKRMDLVELLENAINDYKYVFMPIDMYEIHHYEMYKKRHRVHHVFLTGYNNDKKVFYAHDNFKGGQYRIEEIPYKQIVLGYNTLISDEVVAAWSEIGGICFYNFAQKPWHKDKQELYEVNMQTICSGIREYLMVPEYCNSYSHISYYRYGVDCYKELVNWLHYGIDFDECYVDHRAFSAMRDHKKVMLFRLQYLQSCLGRNFEEYIDAYDKIKKTMDTIIMKIMKGNTAKNKKQFISCVEMIDSVKIEEISTLKRFLALNSEIASEQEEGQGL